MKDNFIQTHNPNLVDKVAESASEVIHTTQHAADQALDNLDHSVQQMREQASPRFDAVAQRASALAQQGAQSVRDTSNRLRDGAMHLTDDTRHYVRNEPLKSVLIAAATGAVLMGLASLLARPGR
jgi:ElaB/YqjD/DUF883 family membrane-anchored ribosome-binding protein